MHHLRLPAVLCACAMLALPAAALARPGSRGFNATYPVASSLCARVAGGHAPPRLAKSVVQVTAACAALRTSFANAQNAYTTTVAPLRQQASAAIAALHGTCRHIPRNPAACRTARAQTRALLSGLRTQVRAAAVAYHTAVDAARRTFWATIHALRGGATLPADNTVGPGPVTVLPSNTAINQA